MIRLPRTDWSFSIHSHRFVILAVSILLGSSSVKAADFDPFNPKPSSSSSTPISGGSAVEVPVAQAGAQSPVDPTARSFSVTDVATVTEGPAAVATFHVALNKVSTKVLSVSYTTANGTATSGSDYQIRSGKLTFQPGTISMTVTVPIVNNAEPPSESSEFFYLSLSNNSSGTTIARSLGRATIVDPAVTLPKIRINDAPSVTEGNTGTKLMSFAVKLDASSTNTVSVKFATADGTAKIALNDYVAKSGTVTFAPGQTTKTITVAINGDTIKGVNETVFVNLSNPVNGTIVDGQGVGTILNDD